MKTTQKRNILFIMGMLAMMLVFGSVLAGCDDGNNNRGSGKPSALDSNATADEALAKLDEIIEYSDTLDNSDIKSSVKDSAQKMKDTWKSTSSTWSTNKTVTINIINSMIDLLP